MITKLQNSQGTITLPGSAQIMPGDWNQRTGVTDRYGRHGGNPSGDWKVSARKVTVNMEEAFETDASFNTFAESLTAFFQKEYEPHYLINDTEGKRAYVAPDSTPITWTPGLEKRFVKVKLKLIMLDGLWEDVTPSTDTWSSIANGDTRVINNTSLYGYTPYMKITAIDNVIDFTLKNLTTGAGLQFASASFVTGQDLIIDPTDYGEILLGTVSSGYTESSASMIAGGFLELIAGNNTLEYTSVYGSVTIVTTLRPVYVW